jgi:hypothetical protein
MIGVNRRMPTTEYHSRGCYGRCAVARPSDPDRSLPGRRTRYLAERNYLRLTRAAAVWSAQWNLKESGFTLPLPLCVNPGGKLVNFPERYWPNFGLGGALARVLSI